MATFVLIPGADGRAWYWHRLVPELHARGNDVVTVELPHDNSAGLVEYADAVVQAIGDRAEVVLVAQSLGGFTAPLVCDRVPVDELVLVNAMVPVFGESAGGGSRTPVTPLRAAEFAARSGRDPDAPFDLRGQSGGGA